MQTSERLTCIQNHWKDTTLSVGLNPPTETKRADKGGLEGEEGLVGAESPDGAPVLE